MSEFGGLTFGSGAFGGWAELLPTMTLEVAFDTDPLDPSPVWTDISDYWNARETTTIGRGRASETDDVQPGVLSLTLDNTDGRFTAGLTSSPYYPNVTVNRRIRVSAEYDSVTYRLFDGHVDKWPVGWENGVTSLVQVTATDRFKLLARRPLRTPLEEEVLADGPVAFWPFADDLSADTAGEVSRATSQFSLVTVDYKLGPGTLEFGSDWRMNYSTAFRWEPDADTGGRTVLQGDPAAVPTAAPFSVEGWFLISTNATSAFGETPLVASMKRAESGAEFSAAVRNVTNTLEGQLIVRTSTGDSIWSASRVDDGEWHHWCYTVAADGVTHTLYIDGEVSTAGTSSAAVTVATADFLWFGGYLPGSVPSWVPYNQPLHGRQARVAFYDTELSANRVLEHYNLGRPSFTELSSDRVERLAGYADIPTGTIETGVSLVAADQDTSGKGVMDALLEVARSENGLVFIAGDGTLTFHARTHRQNQTASATLDASTGEVNTDLEFELSDALTVNDIAVDRPRGGPVRTVDQTSVDTYGTYAEQVSTILTSDEETQAFGEYQIARRATPAPRAGRVSVDPFTDSSLYPTALGTELGSRISLTNLPATAPATTVDVVVEGVEHRFSIDGWVTTWDTSPADLNEYLILDTSELDAAVLGW